MNKQEFLNTLSHHLRKLKKKERAKYLDYYDEMISDIVENGATEEEAIGRQGNIEQIASEILAGASPDSLKVRDVRGICLTAASLILLFFSVPSLLFRLQAQMQMSAAIGIIGGADGPTSIFVAGKIGSPWGLYIATAVVVIVTVVYFVKKYRKK